GERPPRASLRAALGRDDQHTVRRFGAVKCRRGRTLQHFELLDRVRIEIVEARRIATAACADEALSEAAAAVHANAVDVHNGLVRLRKTRIAANTNARPFAGKA